MIILAGLGNPGAEYKQTRHNVGFWLIDQIARIQSISNFQKKFNSEFATISVDSLKIGLLKPQTYMNLSGRAVGEVARFYKVASENVIVIHDELDLSVGKVKIKQGGSSGGHHGLNSIDASIGPDYWRIRIGIDHPGSKEKVPSYVLSKMEENDKIRIDSIIKFLANNLKEICKKEFQQVQEEINKLP